MNEHVPDPARFRPVSTLLRRHAEADPDKIFLQSVEDGGFLTHAETLALCERFAGYFADRGLSPGDRILVLSENGLEQMALLFACLATGVAYCTINVEVNAKHIPEMARRLDPRLVVWGRPGDAIDLGREAIPLKALFDEAGAYPPATLPEIGEDGVAVIGFTSGTAAAPKGMIHNHGNYFWIADQTIDMWKLGPADRVLEYRSFSWPSTHMLTAMPMLVAGGHHRLRPPLLAQPVLRLDRRLPAQHGDRRADGGEHAARRYRSGARRGLRRRPFHELVDRAADGLPARALRGDLRHRAHAALRDERGRRGRGQPCRRTAHRQRRPAGPVPEPPDRGRGRPARLPGRGGRDRDRRRPERVRLSAGRRNGGADSRDPLQDRAISAISTRTGSCTSPAAPRT